MMYTAYQMQADFLEPVKAYARIARAALEGPFGGLLEPRALAHLIAGQRMVARMGLSHHRPAFGIASVTDGNREVLVREEVALDLPFGNLLHFAKETDRPQPRVLVVAPLSGHFATLLRNTVATLAREHDVFITDWKNARDIPTSAGAFGVDEYTDYLVRFLRHMGEGSHMVAVCQPCVQALAATALMADDADPATPKSLTLMAGPIDTRINPTAVNDLAKGHSIEWFEKNLLATVPLGQRGAGRRVYPGFLQLTAFVAMNMDRHTKAHQQMFEAMAVGREADAAKTADFYDEYFAVLDLTAEFYIETVKRVFQDHELARGQFEVHGRKVNPATIRKTSLFTVEGERDDICAVGQTMAAHDLCSSLRPYRKKHYLQAGAGHYGVFSGKRWENQIYPQLRNVILQAE